MKVIKNAVVNSKIHLPAKKIDTSKLRKHYLIHLFNETMCARCPVLPVRFAPECETCPGYKGNMQLYNEKTVNDVDYFSLPPCNLSRLEDVLDIKLKDIDDRRPIHKLPYKLKFTGKLFTGGIEDGRQTVDQEAIVQKWLKTKEGIISAAPRSGKTILSIAIVCKLNVKTIIIADKIDLLKQFYRAFMGDPRKGRLPMTNVPDLQTKKRPIIGIVEKVEDIKKYDICLVNYQKFIKKETADKRINKYLKGQYTLLVCDEIHGAAAPAFSKFVSRLDCKYRLGLSATVFRKDGRSQLLPSFLGPIVARAAAQAFTPKISIVETGVYSKYPYKNWVYAMKFLAKHEERTELIIRQIFKDYKTGHKSIIIPVDFKTHAFELQRRINKEAIDRGLKENFAQVFHQGCNREKILHDADRGKIPVLIGIRSMIRQGLDLSVPSMIYIIVPMSAIAGVGAPLFYQMSMRVASWLKDKKPPEIRIFVDGITFSTGCFRSLWTREIFPSLKSETPKYAADEYEMKRAWQIVSDRNYKPINPVGVYKSSKKLLEEQGTHVQLFDNKGKVATLKKRRF
jgi:superfamily II DNA or RNA helicase